MQCFTARIWSIPKGFQRFRINKLIIFVSRSRKCWRSIATRNGRHLNLNHQFTFVSSGYQSTVLAMHIHDLNLADDKSVCVCVEMRMRGKNHISTLAWYACIRNQFAFILQKVCWVSKSSSALPKNTLPLLRMRNGLFQRANNNKKMRNHLWLLEAVECPCTVALHGSQICISSAWNICISGSHFFFFKLH